MTVRSMVELVRAEPEVLERVKAAASHEERVEIFAEYGVEVPGEEEGREQLSLMADVVGGRSAIADFGLTPGQFEDLQNVLSNMLGISGPLF